MDHGAAIGAGNHRVTAAMHNHSRAVLGSGSSAGQFVAAEVEHPPKFALVKGQHLRGIRRNDRWVPRDSIETGSR